MYHPIALVQLELLHSNAIQLHSNAAIVSNSIVTGDDINITTPMTTLMST